MTQRAEIELFDAIQRGEDAMFEQVYDLFHRRVRLIAWRVSHRMEWVDDIVSESWCRAFRQRTSYKSEFPFLVWMAGIVQNVYRETCRKSSLVPTSEQARQELGGERVDELSPEKIAAEAELMDALNGCVDRLSTDDAQLVRMRFFDGKPLRMIAGELGMSESTLRVVRLPAIFKTLRKCLEKKGILFSQLFAAQAVEAGQYIDEDSA